MTRALRLYRSSVIRHFVLKCLDPTGWSTPFRVSKASRGFSCQRRGNYAISTRGAFILSSSFCAVSPIGENLSPNVYDVRFAELPDRFTAFSVVHPKADWTKVDNASSWQATLFRCPRLSCAVRPDRAHGKWSQGCNAKFNRQSNERQAWYFEVLDILARGYFRWHQRFSDLGPSHFTGSINAISLYCK